MAAQEAYRQFGICYQLMMAPTDWSAQEDEGNMLARLGALLRDFEGTDDELGAEGRVIEAFANEINLDDVMDKPLQDTAASPPVKRKGTYTVRREEADRLRREVWQLHQRVQQLVERKREEAALAAARQANKELREQLAQLEVAIADLLASEASD